MPLQLLVFSLTILLIIMVILRFIPNRVLKPLGRIYLLRVPLLTAIGLVAFCGLTWKGGTRSLLGYLRRGRQPGGCVLRLVYGVHNRLGGNGDLAAGSTLRTPAQSRP